VRPRKIGDEAYPDEFAALVPKGKCLGDLDEFLHRLRRAFGIKARRGEEILVPEQRIYVTPPR
jgi:hypothetical protein